jgi:hypothetical protein
MSLTIPNEPTLVVRMIPVSGLTGGSAPGAKGGSAPELNSGWLCAAEHAAHETALARAVAEYPLPNQRLLAYAARNPPPQNWYDEDENLF